MKPINLHGFDVSQQEALLDLLVLGMYSDGRLTAIEDDRIQSLLAGMGCESRPEGERLFDASVTRVRQHLEPPDATLDFVMELARRFPGRELQGRVQALLDELLAADSQLTTEERLFEGLVRDAFSR
ncbi:MAG: hypothetical protein ACYC23_09570 [Limisphaerales bacterium]